VSGLLLIAFMLGPAIALLVLMAVLLTVVEGLSTAKSAMRKNPVTRQECSVCGSHAFRPLNYTANHADRG